MKALLYKTRQGEVDFITIDIGILAYLSLDLAQHPYTTERLASQPFVIPLGGHYSLAVRTLSLLISLWEYDLSGGLRQLRPPLLVVQARGRSDTR